MLHLGSSGRCRASKGLLQLHSRSLASPLSALPSSMLVGPCSQAVSHTRGQKVLPPLCIQEIRPGAQRADGSTEKGAGLGMASRGCLSHALGSVLWQFPAHLEQAGLGWAGLPLLPGARAAWMKVEPSSPLRPALLGTPTLGPVLCGRCPIHPSGCKLSSRPLIAPPTWGFWHCFELEVSPALSFSPPKPLKQTSGKLQGFIVRGKETWKVSTLACSEDKLSYFECLSVIFKSSKKERSKAKGGGSQGGQGLWVGNEGYGHPSASASPGAAWDKALPGKLPSYSCFSLLCPT